MNTKNTYAKKMAFGFCHWIFYKKIQFTPTFSFFTWFFKTNLQTDWQLLLFKMMHKTSENFCTLSTVALWTFKVMEVVPEDHMLLFFCIDYTIWPGAVLNRVHTLLEFEIWKMISLRYIWLKDVLFTICILHILTKVHLFLDRSCAIFSWLNFVVKPNDNITWP